MPGLDRARTYREALDALTAALAEGGVEAARRNAEWMLMGVTGCSRVHLVAHPHRPVTAEQVERLREMVRRRLAHEPVQHILGHAGFYGLRLRVTPDVLIPRPETEVVVEGALRRMEDVDAPRILDVGTGSGAIALACAHDRPDAEVVGCDVSAAALAVARANAAALGLDVHWQRADVLAPAFADALATPFDLVVSNPPYVPPGEAATLAPEVRDHEPPLALFTAGDPLQFYRALLRHVPRLLRPGGWLIVETHADYGSEVAALLRSGGLEAVTLEPDLAGRPRVVSGCRTD